MNTTPSFTGASASLHGLGAPAADDAAEAQASLLELRGFMDRTLTDMINATVDYVYRHFFDDDVPTFPSSATAAAPTRAPSRAAIEAPRDVDDGKDDCAICLDQDDAAAASWKETPCGHRFHGGCLEKWLQAAHTTCPLCRRHVTPPPREESTDDDDSDSEEEEEAAGEPTHDDDDDPVVLFSPRGHLRRRRHEGDDDPRREHARRRFA